LLGNYYEEAEALFYQARCSRNTGNWEESMTQLHRSRELLGLCGMSGGVVGQNIKNEQAEVHLLKSEYTEARSIYGQIVETTSPDQMLGHMLMHS
jgi:hypothetical protein